LGGEFLTRINPGSNVHDDNDTKTALAGGMQDVDIPEPRITQKGILKCPVCNLSFASREDYISHALAKHQPSTSETKM
jgi:hypothetical protein